MKKHSRISILVFCVLLAGGAAFSGSAGADEPKVKVKVIEISGSADGSDDVHVIHEHKSHQRQTIELKLDGDEEVGVYDADDLEVGEARQFFSDSGKEVLLTRTEEGLEVEVEGKKIDIGAHGIHGAGVHKRIFIRKSDDGDLLHDEDHDISVIFDGDGAAHGGHHVVMIDGSELEWTDEEGTTALHMALDGHTSASERLVESGILDELDEDTRRRILEVLDEDVEIRVVRKKVIEIDDQNE